MQSEPQRQEPEAPQVHADSREAIDTFCDQVWLRDGLAATTLASYRLDLCAWVGWLARDQDRSLFTATREDVEAYLAHQFRAKAKVSSISRRLSALRRFYRLHMEGGAIRT